MALRAKIESFRGDHYKLMEKTLLMIFTGKIFTGGDNIASCPFANWAPTFKTTNPELLASLKGILGYHEKFHDAVGKIRELVERGGYQWRPCSF